MRIILICACFCVFVKWNRELVPQDTPFADIAIRDVNLDFIRAIKKKSGYLRFFSPGWHGIAMEKANGIKCFCPPAN